MSNALVKSKVVTGSIQDTARTKGITIAEACIDAEVIAIIDTSGSMEATDFADGRTRYTRAVDALSKIQNDYPGRVIVVAFSSYTIYCPSGIPYKFSGGTDMAKALSFVLPASGLGLNIVIISDGEPDSATEALRVARQFNQKIDTCYIGPENDIRGKKFLEELAQATGGTSHTDFRAENIGHRLQEVLLLT